MTEQVCLFACLLYLKLFLKLLAFLKLSPSTLYTSIAYTLYYRHEHTFLIFIVVFQHVSGNIMTDSSILQIPLVKHTVALRIVQRL